MRLLYIAYTDLFSDANSGSSIRPKKMYDAFNQLGLEVKTLECQQNKYKERRKKVKECIKWLEFNTPDFCYIESPSGPIFNSIDRRLIKLLHKKGIYISYFYRDAFWKFPYKMETLGLIKRNIIYALNKIDLRMLENCCDTIYFPSQGMVDLFKSVEFRNVDILYPGTEMCLSSILERKLNHRIIYVGAVSKIDGTYDLIKAVDIINKSHFELNLIIVCRENEWKALKIKNHDWLTIKHVSYKYLADLYKSADLAVFPRREDEYINISSPVKLCEYISYGKPIVSTKRNEPLKFIKEDKTGILCEDGYYGIMQAILKFYSSAKLRETLLRNVESSCKKNLWIKRANKVITDFKRLKDSYE